MKHPMRTWQLAPKVLRSLLITVLLITMAATAVFAARQPSSPADSRLIAARALPGIYSVPATCSVPIIPAIVTNEEIRLRQYQLDFANFIEEQANLDREAALTTSRDVLSIEKYRLDCEIMLLRAKQALAADSALPSVQVTSQEIDLRTRQFAIAKQLDEEEAIAQEVGVASLNRVWAARRSRIDSEILLVQAKVQKQLQDE